MVIRSTPAVGSDDDEILFEEELGDSHLVPFFQVEHRVCCAQTG